MDGWYGFRAQGIHNNGERKRRVGITPSERDMGLYGTLLQRRYFWHSWYFRDAGCAAWPLGLPLLLLTLALFLLSLHCRQDLQLLRDEVGRIRSGGASG